MNMIPFYKITDAQLKKLCSSKFFQEVFFDAHRDFPYEEFVFRTQGNPVPMIVQMMKNGDLSLANYIEYMLLNGQKVPLKFGTKVYVFEHPVELVYFFNNEHAHAKANKLKKNVPAVNALVAKFPESMIRFKEKFEALKEEKDVEENIAQLPAALTLCVYDKDAVSKRLAAGVNNEYLMEILQKLAQKSNVRVLQVIENLNEKMEQLKEEFPNFKEVIEKIHLDLIRNGCGEGGQIVKFSPILLKGEPGIGKTEFSRQLSNLLNVHAEYIDLSINSSAATLSGISSTYKDSKPGEIFTAIINNDNANSIIFLDEIDKTGSGDGNSNRTALNALFSLLEKSSKEAFRDEFVGIPINASGLNIIAAANNGYIPEPLMDRFRVFNVPVPTPEQSAQIARNIWKKMVLNELPKGNPFDVTLSDDVAHKLGQYKPRKMIQVLENAVAFAIMDQKINLNLEHIQKSINLIEPQNNVSKKPSIGFVG